jgi:hypothetical protein
MIRIHSQKQITLEGFETSFERAMDKNNRWVKLGECMPWDVLAEAYYQSFTTKMGRPVKDSRLVIGAMIIKHKLKLSDEETVHLIQENPYRQYFCGLPGNSRSYIRAKTACTPEAWIHSIFLVMNLLVLVRHFLVPEIILGMLAKLAGIMYRIRRNSRSPDRRILNCRMPASLLHDF